MNDRTRERLDCRKQGKKKQETVGHKMTDGPDKDGDGASDRDVELTDVAKRYHWGEVGMSG